MERSIIMTEQEYEDLKWDIVTELLEFSKKPYGFKMILRETGDELIFDREIRGTLLHPIERAFSIALDGDEET